MRFKNVYLFNLMLLVSILLVFHFCTHTILLLFFSLDIFFVFSANTMCIRKLNDKIVHLFHPLPSSLISHPPTIKESTKTVYSFNV